MYKICIFLILTIFSLSAFSQKPEPNRIISGKVITNKGKKEQQSVEFANISLLQLPDSTFITGTTSNEKGEFNIRLHCDLSQKYVLKTSFTGYASSFLEISGNDHTINAGIILLEEDVKALDEVIVTALVQPVEQKKDTTIFNAEAYKLPDGAYLEALIRRIPGLSYDPKNKSIEYKGEKISEITVNGKEFFKGNTRVALENLPASFVSRLKVYDKATEEEKMTGVKNNQKNYVLDLQTKKAVNGTLMAGMEGGYGSKNKYDAKAQAFNFKENGENLGLVGRFGNRNFTSAYNENRAGNIGGNISRKIGENFQIAANISYNHSKTGNISTSRNELYMSAKNQYGISERSQENRQNAFSSSLNLMWNPDKQTMIHFMGGGNMSRSENTSDTHSAKFNENPNLDLLDPFLYFDQTGRNIRMNETKQNNFSKIQNKGYNIHTGIIHKFTEEGNSLGISYSLYQTRQNNDTYKTSSSIFYQLQNMGGKDSVEVQNQYQYAPNQSENHEIRMDYTWKISSKNNLQISYSWEIQNEKQLQNTYDLPDYTMTKEQKNTLSPANYESHLIDSLSNRRDSRTNKHAIALNYSHEGKNWNMYGGLTCALQRRSLNQYDGKQSIDTTGYSLEWTPFFSVRYNKNDYDISINYNGNTRQPSLYDLMAPTVYHSAVYISKSNPNLKASYQHYLNLSFSNYPKGISAYLTYSQELNGVTQATLYDFQTGSQETYPVNINGNWNIMGNSNYEKRIGSFKLTGRAGGNYNHNVGLVNENNGKELSKSVTHASGVNVLCGISYLPSWGNIDLNGSWDFQQFKNSLNILQESNTYTRNYAISSLISAQLPFHFQLDSDFAYQIRSGSYINSKEQNEALWNLMLTWKFAKERRAEISAIWADILNQRKSLQRSASSSGFYESYAEQLRSYFMISLRYKFNRTN